MQFKQVDAVAACQRGRDNVLRFRSRLQLRHASTEPFSDRNFEPFDSRKEGRPAQEAAVTDPEGESFDEIVSLGREWAKRHNALKSAQKDLRDQVGKEKKTTLLYEALVLEGKYPYGPGYLAVFRVDDKASGLEVGTFRWSLSEDSRGSEYAPNQANLEKLRNEKRDR